MSDPVTGYAAALPWERLRARARLVPGLCQPVPGQPGSCLVCLGPAGAGFTRCYQCERHRTQGYGLLADVVVPVAYAVRGAGFARDLWRYKSWAESDPAVRTSLLALMLVFLHDHGDCAFRAAGMPAPDLLAIVPSGYGRPGVHPLSRLVSPFLRLPRIPLVLRPGEQGRDFNARRFAVARQVVGANVLVMDDTWVSGASIQSAAAALKLAGAARVTAVVLGRFVNAADPGSARLAAVLERRRHDQARYDPAKCAICSKPAIE